MRRMQRIGTIVLVLIISLSATPAHAAQRVIEPKTVYAKILTQVTEETYDEELELNQIVQTMEIEVYSGEGLEGRQFLIENQFVSGSYDDYSLYKVGDRIKLDLYLSEEGYVIETEIYNVVRYQYVLYMAALFIVLLVVIGRMKGLKTILALSITLALVLLIMLPLMQKGYPPLPIAIGISVLATITTFVITSGLTKKSYCAMAGSFVGILAAGLLSLAVAHMADMSGITSEDASYLIYNTQGIVYDLRGILLAGIIVGCLGGVMDVSMSVTSAVFEIHEIADRRLTMRELYRSGMNVGNDVIGTMSNTLILAYAGCSLTLILVVMSYGVTVTDMLNNDYIMAEVVRALAGSIGMLLTVPGAAVLSAYFATKKRKHDTILDDNQPDAMAMDVAGEEDNQ